MVINARSPQALHSLHQPPHHLFSITDRPSLPSPALEEVGVEGGEQEARGDDGQHVFYEEQVCQPPNRLHILCLMGHWRLESIGDTAQGGIWAQVHEGFILGAVSPAGSLAIPAPFEFTSPCGEEDHRSQDSPGVTG